MGRDALEPAEELKEIVVQLKSFLVSHMEAGLEPPSLTTPTLDYLQSEGSPQVNTLDGLKRNIGDCSRCKLHRDRRKLVFGEGSPGARLLFVGEGPGKEEDLEGRPFVGEAGKLLTRIIENGMGLKREEVYICNVVKCRPPRNRDPEPDETEACLPFLKQQLSLIKPEVICTLGRVASQALLGTDFRITRDRGKWRSFMDIPLMPTFHPAYLLRNPSAKRQVWEDVQEIMRRLGLEVQKNEPS